MQRRAAEQSLTDHGKDDSNGRAHVGDAVRHTPEMLGFLRQIGFMGATGWAAAGRGAGTPAAPAPTPAAWWSGRAAALARFLDCVQRHDKVWPARRIDIAHHWRERHPGAGG